MESAAAAVADVAAGQRDLEESLAFNGEVERIARRAHVALQLDNLRSGGAAAETDLEARRYSRLLGGGRARHHQILVQQVLKLEAPTPKACCAGVGQVVGDRVEIQLLRLHSAGGCVK